jgi:hypothetical protein
MTVIIYVLKPVIWDQKVVTNFVCYSRDFVIVITEFYYIALFFTFFCMLILFPGNFCSASSDQALVLPQREFNPNSGFENLLAKNG